MTPVQALAIAALLAAVAVSGCTHNQHRADAERAYYERQAQLAENRPPILELTAQPGETIMLSGVQRLAVYSPAATDARVEQYRGEPSPWVTAFRELQSAALGFSGIYYGARVLDTALKNAGGNTTVGGNLGDTRRDTAGGNIGDTRRDTIGRDQIGGDRIDIDESVGRDRVGGDWRRGDDLRDTCIGDECRVGSPGPFDDSVTNPPDDPGDGDPGDGDP